jgi:hypothetical protein
MPVGCILADKGPAIFVENDDEPTLLALLAVTNSAVFRYLVELQMAFGSYEVGVIQRTPVPADLGDQLPALARRAHDLQRQNYVHDETTHVFGIPTLVAHRAAPTLTAAAGTHAAATAERAGQLAAVQGEIDAIVARLYGVEDLRLTIDDLRLEEGPTANVDDLPGTAEDADDDEPSPDDRIVNRKSEIVNLLMYAVGVAFGRWDVRYALDPALLPPLPGPFDPLPRFAPGAFTISDLRLTIEESDPLVNRKSKIVNHLVDEPGHPSDMVGQVREVLELMYGPRAEAIEREACAALGVADLRDYFRDPRRFFAHHVRRYSKSRRKAPIYWPLQTARRAYTLWLYYPRLRPGDYLRLARDVVDPRVRRAEAAAADLRTGLEGLSGAPRRRREAEIERAAALVEELDAFRRVLDRVGIAGLEPDPNDGVLLSIAPLHEIVPWKEAAAAHKALRAGQYGWSTMAKKMK